MKPQTLKGFRDFLPPRMAVRNYIKNILVGIFENFGFEPLETPALEYASTLLGKYGQEADKLVYQFTDQGGRRVGLRYDLTVPVSRVLATSPNLPLPFKRYQIQPLWRAEKPQKGRYREFTQCDIDTLGSSSPTSDAEIIAIIYTAFKKLNFPRFSIRINSRQVLFQILDVVGIKTDQKSILQSLDKFQKIGQTGVRNELRSKNLSDTEITSLFNYIKRAQPDPYLQNVFSCLEYLGVDQNFYAFDPALVRGLDYYTGPIFETYVEEPKIGSITGGGRYDNLVKSLGGPDLPAVGTTLGLDRLADCIEELNLIPFLSKTNIKIMLANFGSKTEKNILQLSTTLRQNNINTLFYPDPEKLSKQFKYASDKNIPLVAVLGPDELAQNKVTLKNMATGEQQTISQLDLLAQLA